jgi:cytohesin
MGVDIDWRDEQDLTALHHAVLSGFEDVVELLLDRGADVNAPSTTAGLPLCLAVLKDRSHILRLLLDKFRAAVNLADPELGTPFHCAGFTGNCDIAEILLQHGAEPDPVNRVDLLKLLPYRDTVSSDKLAARGPWSRDYTWTKITPLVIAVFATNLDLAKLLLRLDNDKSLSTFAVNDSERSGFHFLHAAARWGSSEMVALTILHTKDVNVADSNGTTALKGATLKNKPDSVKQLLRANAAGDPCDSKGNTALIIAGHFGLDGCLKELIDDQVSLDLFDYDKKRTALMCASSQGHVSCVRQLAKAGASLGHHDKYGETALICASRHGFDKCVKELIDAGASLDLTGLNRETALIRASAEGHDDCVRRLIKAGASIDVCTTDGRTALMRASAAGHHNCVRRLIKADASIDIRDESGNTALTKAAALGHSDCVKQLIEAGASVGWSNDKDSTALIFASMNGNQDCVEQLLRAGASVAAKTKQHKSTALHEAAIRGHTKCAQMLHDHGADINARRSSGSTALYCAASHNQLECVQWLLKHQADPDLTAARGWTPLMAAVDAKGSLSAAIVEALLQAGANVATRTPSARNTALHVAARRDKAQIAKMLLDAGASAAVVNKYNEKPLDEAKPDTAVHALLQAWDKDHSEEPGTGPEMQKTQVGSETEGARKTKNEHGTKSAQKKKNVHETESAQKTQASPQTQKTQKTQIVPEVESTQQTQL